MRLLQATLAIVILVLFASEPSSAFGLASSVSAQSNSDALPVLSVCSTSVRGAHPSPILSICPTPNGGTVNR
jgi:hypothetical protein